MDYLATDTYIDQRRFNVGRLKGIMLYNPDLTDKFTLRNAIKTLESVKSFTDSEELVKNILEVSQVEVVKDQPEAMDRMFSGDALVIIETVPDYIVIDCRKWDKRAVAEPPTETVLRGPREGFIEDIKTNLSMLERRLKTPALAIERLKLGRVSSTNVVMLYVSTIASPELVNLVRQKLKGVDVDALIDSHYLEPVLEAHPYSIFHQMGVSEKPDIVAAKVLEGRVAILVDGSPMVLTAPFLLVEDFQNSEDYYQRSAFSTFLRLLRYVAVFLGIFLPGLYVALQNFHYDVIPLRFLVTLMNAIKGIPLPPLPEVLFVLLLFEIIREASVRMPRAVGMAMSIVGALVLGETAVKAGIIGSPAVMIVALSSISLYTVPNEVGTLSLLRIIYILMGGLAGLYGLLITTLFLTHHLVSLDSFGSPYLAPFAPLVKNDLKDGLIRSTLINQKTRPESIPNINSKRRLPEEEE